MQRNCNEKESTGAKNFSSIYICMQSSKGLENKPAVGNGFFENGPPVRKTDYLSPLRKFNEVKQVTATSVTETRKSQKPKAVLKAPETIFVKGFGGTPLFVLGMFAKAEATGECVRLDDDTGKKGKLSEVEQICKRNSTMVKRLHQEQVQLEDNNNECEANEDALMPTDFPDDSTGF